jgi:hypothetical protein
MTLPPSVSSYRYEPTMHGAAAADLAADERCDGIASPRAIANWRFIQPCSSVSPRVQNTASRAAALKFVGS